MNINKIIRIILFMTWHLHGCQVNELHQQARHHLEKHNKEEAVDYLIKAHAIDPYHDEITIQLASVYFFSRDYEKAIPYFEHYLAQKPYDSDMLFYLGSAYNRLGRFECANEYFKKSYDHSRDSIAKIELLKNYLRSGNWHEAHKYLTPKLWWYNYSIYGKRILLDMSQSGNGIGDIIFFLRYAKNLKQAGAQVTVHVPEMLHPLCNCCPYVDEVIHSQNDMSTYDHILPICIASLMMCSHQKLYLRSHEVPYLIAPPKLSTEWKEKLHNTKNLKIGLYWEGTANKARFLGKQLENPRTVPAHYLNILQSVEGVQWYNLQKHTTDWPDFVIHSFGAEFDTHGAFMDSMAIMPHLDLIISIDGSMSHLAGALGVPVWVMLPVENDYRWLSNRTDSPWYPTMRLFRQKQFGNWDTVISEIKHELTHLLLLES